MNGHSPAPDGAQVSSGEARSRSRVVMLLGSADFARYFEAWRVALTLAGHVVLTPIFDVTMFAASVNTAAFVDSLMDDRTRKVRLATDVVLLNRFAYIDATTLADLREAEHRGRDLYALESWGRGLGIGPGHSDKVRAARRHHGIPENYVSPIDTTGMKYAMDLFGPAGARRAMLVEIVRRVEVIA